MLPLTLRLYLYTHLITMLPSGNSMHRRTKINDIEPATQGGRQHCSRQYDIKHLVFSTHIQHDALVRQVDDHTSFAITATPEINIVQRRQLLMYRHRQYCFRYIRIIRAHRDDEVMAVNPRGVSKRTFEVV